MCGTSGTPGLSYGVLHDGELLYKHNYGYRDVEAQLPTTSATIYHLGSLTKAFTAAAVGILVEDEKIHWDTPIHDMLPLDFHLSDPALTENMTIVDPLSHRMGLQRSNQLWSGNDNVLLLKKEQTIPHVQYLKTVQPFRGNFHYNNWGYGLAGEIIENLTSESWGNLVQKKLLEPLHMDRSGVRQNLQDHDFAKGYTALDDRSFYPLAPVQAQDGEIMGSSQGMVSTVDDMLKWCQALVSAMSYQQGSDSASGVESPLKQVAQLTTSHTPLAKPFDQSTYGMGWVRAPLPAPLGATGCNPGFVAKMPVVGQGSDEVVLYHQGSLAGYTSSVFLLPSTKSAIVVLTNSISLNDCADWVGQLILETMLGTTRPNDYQGYAQESSDKHIAKFPSMQKSLEEQQIKGTSPKPLEAYIGNYSNSIDDFVIKISIKSSSDNLELPFQGLHSQVWEMKHYNYDIFTWLMPRDEAVKRARFPYSPEKVYKLEFIADSDGRVSSLLWAHDVDSPPEKFVKSNSDLGNPRNSENGLSEKSIAW